MEAWSEEPPKSFTERMEPVILKDCPPKVAGNEPADAESKLAAWYVQESVDLFRILLTSRCIFKSGEGFVFSLW